MLSNMNPSSSCIIAFSSPSVFSIKKKCLDNHRKGDYLPTYMRGIFKSTKKNSSWYNVQ